MSDLSARYSLDAVYAWSSGVCATRRMNADKTSSLTKFPAWKTLVNGRDDNRNAGRPYQFQDAEDGVDVPSFVRSEPLRSKSDLGSQSELEFVVRDLQERQELAHKNANILLID